MPRVRASILFVCLFVPTLVSAQSGRSLSGVVRDTSGAVLPGVTIDALIAGRAIASTTSAADGGYKLEVPGAAFGLLARLNGFADQLIDVAPGDATIDVVMHVGSMADRVVVTAARGPESRAKVTQS